jgi:hypothetical protein
LQPVTLLAHILRHTKENLRSWLLAPESLLGADQFAIRYAEETEIYWNNDTSPKPEPIFRKTVQSPFFLSCGASIFRDAASFRGAWPYAPPL